MSESVSDSCPKSMSYYVCLELDHRGQNIWTLGARLENEIRQKEPTIKRTFVEPDSLNRAEEHRPRPTISVTNARKEA